MSISSLLAAIRGAFTRSSPTPPMPDNTKLKQLTQDLTAASQRISTISQQLATATADVASARQDAADAHAAAATAQAAQQTAETQAADYKTQLDAATAKLDALPDLDVLTANETAQDALLANLGTTPAP